MRSTAGRLVARLIPRPHHSHHPDEGKGGARIRPAFHRYPLTRSLATFLSLESSVDSERNRMSCTMACRLTAFNSAISPSNVAAPPTFSSAVPAPDAAVDAVELPPEPVDLLSALLSFWSWPTLPLEELVALVFVISLHLLLESAATNGDTPLTSANPASGIFFCFSHSFVNIFHVSSHLSHREIGKNRTESRFEVLTIRFRQRAATVRIGMNYAFDCAGHLVPLTSVGQKGGITTERSTLLTLLGLAVGKLTSRKTDAATTSISVSINGQVRARNRRCMPGLPPRECLRRSDLYIMSTNAR